MNLFILTPQENLDDNSPWFLHFSKIHCFIVLANNEDEARKIADMNSGIESNRDCRCWLDPKLSHCKKINIENSDDPQILSYVRL